MSDSSRHRQLLRKASKLWTDWCNLQALQDSETFADLNTSEQVQSLVLGKQVQAFDNALSVVHMNMSGFAIVTRELERLSVEASKLTGSSMSMAAAAECRGPEPSAIQYTEMLQDMWRACRDELLLKQAMMSSVTFATEAPELAALVCCFSDEPNIPTDDITAFLDQVAQAAPSHP
eukprot:jgi/Chrzof1/11929/Cz06g15010.t1